MHAFIWYVESGSIPIPEWVDWGVLSEVRLLIYRVLHLRTDRRVKATCRMALKYTHIVLDLIRFTHVLIYLNEHLLPAALLSHPLVTFKYNDPICRSWVNSNRVIHTGLPQQPSNCVSFTSGIHSKWSSLHYFHGPCSPFFGVLCQETWLGFNGGIGVLLETRGTISTM